MKVIPLLLVPSIALLVSACAPEPEHHGYGGPNYYGHTDRVYVEGGDNDHRGYRDDRYRQDQYDVNVNRTNVNERTVNRTNVNETTVNRTNVKNGGQNKGKQTTAAGSKRKGPHKSAQTNENDQAGNQQQAPRP